MNRKIFLTGLLALVAQSSWGVSLSVNKTLEWMEMGETASEQQLQEIGSRLPKLNDSERDELILEGLKSSKRAVRFQIAELVNKVPNNEKYIDLLFDIGEHDPDADVRKSAFDRVSSIDNNRGKLLARKLISDSDAFVRRSALVGLALSSEPDDIRAVESALKTDHLYIRSGLTRTLVFHGKPYDGKIAHEGLDVDLTWFQRNPITPNGYSWRKSSSGAQAMYVIRLIREDALFILGRKGTQKDITYLERTIKKVNALGDKDFFGVRAQGTIHEIQLRELPEDSRLGYLESKLRDPRPWVRSWAAVKLCSVNGGLETIDAIAKDPAHPAHKRVRNMRIWCSQNATGH